MPDFIVFDAVNDQPSIRTRGRVITANDAKEAATRVAFQAGSTDPQQFAVLDFAVAQIVNFEPSVAYTVTDADGAVTLTKEEVVALEVEAAAPAMDPAPAPTPADAQVAP